MTIEEFAERLKRMVDENNHISPIDIDIVLQGAKSERTNWEKWKEELKVDVYARMVYDTTEKTGDCSVCPLFDKPCNIDCISDITEWANKKADDEVKE